MSSWLRGILAIAAGLVVWFAVATAGNLAIRWLVPGYADVEKAMNFSMGMLIARLLLGAIASLAAGAACVAIARSARIALYLFAVLLLALFVLVHVELWAKFPVWYHLVFLGSIIPLIIIGAKMPAPRRSVRPDGLHRG